MLCLCFAREDSKLNYKNSELTDRIYALVDESIRKVQGVQKSGGDTGELAASLSDEIMKAVDEALEAHDKFRIQEGGVLIADLLHRVDLIQGYKQSVVPFEVRRTEVIRQRILDQLSALAVNYDANRLEQEMIFYLEKLDITEEKVRLDKHCDYFREVASGEENVGRKLGFVAQEMGREINTMGSKANDSEIQILVVKMKDELEKIKEQVLNIL